MKEGWIYKPFAECIDKVSKQKQVKSKDYQSSGKYPIVSQEKELISGYWDDDSYLYKHEKPVIIFGDHTKEIKFIDFDFVVGADGTQILSPKVEFDAKFFYYALVATPLRSLGYARHFKLLKEKSFPIPSLSEQQSIVEYLDSAFAKIDAMKANAEKALNEAKALFQASLKEMLEPKEGWEEKTLKDLGLTQTGTTPSKSDKANYGDYIEFIRPSEIDYDGNGSIDYNCEMRLSKQGASKGRIFASNSIFMVCIGATIGKVGFSTKDISCNQQINVFTPKDVINYKFAYYAMRSPSFQYRVIKEGTSSQATLPIINKGKWEQLSIKFPVIEDQEIIATRLDSLSSKVLELKANYDKISQECDAFKQAILRQVFE